MRFLLRFYLSFLLLASAGLTLLFCTTSYALLVHHIRQVAAMLHGSEAQDVFTPERYAALRLVLATTALLALGLGFRVWRAEAVSAWWAREGRPAWVALGRPWRQMSRAQRTTATGVGLGLVAARLWYGLGTPFVLDETTSYDYSVLPGADVTASYYPYPNNHVFANLLVGLVHWVLPGASPLVALRLLPTLAGLLALPVVYLLLLRHARMEVVTLGLGLFLLSPKGVFYAIAGRGYAWTMLAAFAGLCATLELLRPPTRRLGWVLYALVTIWLPIAIAQRVAPPARTLLTVFFAFLLVAALLGQVVVLYWPSLRRLRVLALPGISLLLCLGGGYRLNRQWTIFCGWKQRQEAMLPAYHWLRSQHLRRIWVDSDETVLMWHHLALSAGEAPLPLVVEVDAPTTQPGPVGEVEVISVSAPPTPLRPNQPLLFQCKQIFILPVSPTQPRVFKPEQP